MISPYQSLAYFPDASFNAHLINFFRELNIGQFKDSQITRGHEC